MSAPLAPGLMLEARVARLLHREGAFVRTSVDLNGRFRERSGITDIDVLAFYIDPTLRVRVVNGECKSTESKSAPSSGDRLLWLVGVSKLLDAHGSFLVTTKNASDATRLLAQRLHTEILDTSDLTHRERLLGLDATSPYGVHAPELLAVRAEVQRRTSADKDLQRVYAFARSELWLTEPVAALKRAMGAFRVIASRYAATLPEPDRRAINWLIAEVLTGFTLAITAIAGDAYRKPEDVFERQFHETLAEGVASYGALRETSRAVDKYVQGLLTQYGIDPTKSVAALGAFEPHPPAYAEPLTELVTRLALSAKAAAELPRLAEHLLLARVHPPVGAAPPPATDAKETLRLLRLVAVFLERQAGVPADLLDPLRANGVSSPEDRTETGNGSGPTVAQSERPEAEIEKPKLFSRTE